MFFMRAKSPDAAAAYKDSNCAGDGRWARVGGAPGPAFPVSAGDVVGSAG